MHDQDLLGPFIVQEICYKADAAFGSADAEFSSADAEFGILCFL